MSFWQEDAEMQADFETGLLGPVREVIVKVVGHASVFPDDAEDAKACLTYISSKMMELVAELNKGLQLLEKINKEPANV